MKHVFPNNEIAHVFFSRVQSSGRTSNSTIYFDEDTIYSYGPHFPMAVITDKAAPNGKPYLLVNSRSYSVTTSHHMSNVWSAIPSHLYEIIHLPLPFSYFDIKNHFCKGIEQAITNAARARKYPEHHISEAAALQSNLLKYLDYAKPEYIAPEVQPYLTMTFDNDAVKAAKDRADKARAAKQAQFKQDIAGWLKGEKEYLSREVSNIYLRAKGDEIETSLGAMVPMAEGLLLLRAIQQNKPVHGAKIGYYTVVSYSNDVLHVGCHKLHRKEIDRFAASQNWI